MKENLNEVLDKNEILHRENDNKKKTMPVIAKNQFIRYMRRHSPNKLRNYHTSNETYIMDKAP